MRTSLVSRPLHWAARARQRVALRAAQARDDGFILLESIIAISLITVIMGAIGAEYVSGIASTSRQRATQIAVQLADSAVEQIRALDPSDLVTGRDTASVNTEFTTNVPTLVQPWLANMDQASDPTAAAGSGPTATIPTVGVTQKPGNASYTVTDYLGWCYLLTTGSSTTCVKLAQSPNGTQYVRAVVAVTWAASSCPATGCAYVTSTLVSATDDPTFKINQPLPAAPSVNNPGNQTVAVGDVVSLQLAVANSTGVPPFFWSSTASLPTGLSISPAGLISGTVGGSATTVSSTVSVLDAYNRAATASFTWTVKPPLVGASPGAQASTTITSVNLTLSASGGSGAPYTWADPSNTLPPGLSISSAGRITGTPTTIGNYSVNVVVTDASGTRTDNDPFTWTVNYPPISASNPGAQTATVGTAITPTLQLSGSGGSGNYVWSDPSGTLPAGLTLTSAGLISGSPTTTRSYTVNLTLSDPVAGYTTTTGNFTWSVVAKPTVTAPAAQNSTVGSAINLSYTSTCLNAPCTYVLNNGPAGLTATSSAITGTVTGSAGTFTPTITVTDADGASTTSASFTWTVTSPPLNITYPTTTQYVSTSAAVNIQATYVGGTAPMTWSATSLPTGLSISTSGLITGTPTNGAGGTYSATLRVTDSKGAFDTQAVTWKVLDITAPGATISRLTSNNTYSTTATAAGATGTLTWSATSLPTGLSMAANGTISGKTQTAGVWTSTIKVNDSIGTSDTQTVTWYIGQPVTLVYPTSSGLSSAHNSAVSVQVTAVGGSGSYQWFGNGGIPTGVSLSSSGLFTGTTPNYASSWTVSIYVRDTGNGNAATYFSPAFTWTIT